MKQKRFRVQVKSADGPLLDNLKTTPSPPAWLVSALIAYAEIWQGKSEHATETFTFTPADPKAIAMLADVKATRDVSRLIRDAAFFYMGIQHRMSPQALGAVLIEHFMQAGLAPVKEEDDGKETDRWLDDCF